MLILTRRIDESLIINDNVKLTILGVKGNQVRIGIEAPKDVSVHRQEIYKRIAAGMPKPTVLGEKLCDAINECADEWEDILPDENNK